MHQKRCNGCEKLRSLDEFYRAPRNRDGHQSMCKECQNASSRQWAKDHPEEHARIGRETYHRNPDKARARNKRFRENNSGYQKQWVKTNPEKRRAYVQTNLLRYPEKNRAHVAVRMAVDRGDLPRANTLKCVRCGRPAQDYHHHKGYDQEHWLDVIPTCKRCHRQLETQ